MLVRICTGIVLIAAVLAWLFVADYAVFSMGALFMYMVGAYEMGPLCGFKSRIPLVIVAAACATALFYFAPPGNFPLAGIPVWCYWITSSGLIVWLCSLPLLIKFPKGDDWHKNKVLAVVFSMLMLVPFLEGLLILRADDYANDSNAGAYLVLAVMALVWCADSGAYFTGRAIGRTPMIPRVSPKKTLEGLAGGLLLALIALVVFLHFGWFSSFGSSLQVMIISGMVTILFSVVGDLVESMLKRMAGIKDSGRIFPGHGGMLDRIDSQLAAIPVFVSVNFFLGNTQGSLI